MKIADRKGQSGQGLAEYGLILGLIAVVVIVLLLLVGPTIANIINPTYKNTPGQPTPPTTVTVNEDLYVATCPGTLPEFTYFPNSYGLFSEHVARNGDFVINVFNNELVLFKTLVFKGDFCPNVKE